MCGFNALLQAPRPDPTPPHLARLFHAIPPPPPRQSELFLPRCCPPLYPLPPAPTAPKRRLQVKLPRPLVKALPAAGECNNVLPKSQVTCLAFFSGCSLVFMARRPILLSGNMKNHTHTHTHKEVTDPIVSQIHSATSTSPSFTRPWFNFTRNLSANRCENRHDSLGPSDGTIRTERGCPPNHQVSATGLFLRTERKRRVAFLFVERD